MATPGSWAGSKRAERVFFGGMSALIAVTILLGFARTYYLRTVVGAPSPPLPTLTPLSTLFVLPLVVWDWMTLRRLHPATLWGGLLVVGSGPLRLAIAFTDAWLAFANWTVALVK